MMPNWFDNLRMYARFTLGLKGFLRNKLTIEEAEAIVKKRMERREEHFLALVEKGIFGYRKSPYLALFQLSRIGFRDVKALVSREGVEGTLKILKEEGVYFTIGEYKGRQAVIRKGSKFIVNERDFDNPYVSAAYERQSGGTRSAGTRVRADFDFLANFAVYYGLTIKLWDLSGFPVVILQSVFPFGVGMIETLRLSKFGVYPVKWISLIDEKSVPISLRTKSVVRYILYMSKIFGANFPMPEFVDFNRLDRVLKILKALLSEHGGCVVHAHVSTAFRICLAAQEKGEDLKGVSFIGAGEPLTLAKQRLMESVGARYILYYAFTEVGVAASSCPDSWKSGDVHLYKDYLGMISYSREVLDSHVDAFLFTTLLFSAPKILFNVESGDYGIIDRKKCGCLLGQLGYDVHFHNIQSFEKLCAGSMTFYGEQFVELVEKILPVQFGGSSLDYQFIEEEDKAGVTHVFVVVSPKIGPLDEDILVDTVLRTLSHGSDSQRVMALTWRQARTIRVRRQEPILTRTGKLYPLHILHRR